MKTLIRLGGCPDWSESSLGAHAILLVLSWGGLSIKQLTLRTRGQLFPSRWPTGYSANQSKWATTQQNVSSGVSDQARHKPACAATEASQSLEILALESDILAIESRDIILSKQRTTKALIRLRGCAGWSAPLLFAYGIKHIFSWSGTNKKAEGKQNNEQTSHVMRKSALATCEQQRYRPACDCAQSNQHLYCSLRWFKEWISFFWGLSKCKLH